MEPLTKFSSWYRRAIEAGEKLPEACALATATKSGRPSVRFILFKKIEKRAIHFFTNYDSRKAVELGENPFAEIAVFWPKIYLQVRLSGRVQRLPARESDAYWKGRPRKSQLSAWASPQSREVSSRASLEKRLKLFEAKFMGQDVPRPPNWGGYRLNVSSTEFWTGETYRLHRREVYRFKGSGWIKAELAP
jgi:pyridoxamine 5'-phosphate oxidase